jgi:hypothetical protein
MLIMHILLHKEKRMYKKLILMLSVMSKYIFGLLLLAIQVPLCQSKSGPTAKVVDAKIIRSISVEINISSQEKELLIPYCGDGEGVAKELCYLSFEIEVKTQEGWCPLNTKDSNIIIGGKPRDKWNIQRIPAGKWERFLLSFNVDLFAIEKDQILRVIIDAWADKQSMRTGKNAIKLTTNEFKCP